MTARKPPSVPRLTPLVPPRPKPPANAAIEEYQRKIRASSPDVDELEVEVKATFEGLALHLAREHRINRARDRLMVAMARQQGLADIVPFELADSRPPPALEGAQPTPLLPRIGRDVAGMQVGIEKIQKEVHVTRREKLIILIGNFALAGLLVTGAVLGRITFEQAFLVIGALALPGAGSVALNALRERAKKEGEP